ncbi:hypothetical protein E2C01_010067 [Portunus trituberculatus]|uniref:Uncharacterized protein n=1 Tax=Portunus trituberculatus TaxID=210409 RepID=A0A5B7D7G7_PORTR|nr:hypothetical protein [Portunus trituberculatus]
MKAIQELQSRTINLETQLLPETLVAVRDSRRPSLTLRLLTYPSRPLLYTSPPCQHNTAGKSLGTSIKYSKPPHLANLSLAKFTFSGRVATDHRVHAWRFEFKLGGPLAAAQRTTWLPSDRGNKFWRFIANMSSTSATDGTGRCKDNCGGGKDESGLGKRKHEAAWEVFLTKMVSESHFVTYTKH